MPPPAARPMERRTGPLTGSIQAERQASITGSQNRMVEPRKARAAGSRRLPAALGDPGALNGPATQDPAEVQLAGHVGRPAAGASPGPLQMQGADETPECHALADVLSCRAGVVPGSSFGHPAGSGQRRDPADRPVAPVTRTDLPAMSGASGTAGSSLPANGLAEMGNAATYATDVSLPSLASL